MRAGVVARDTEAMRWRWDPMRAVLFGDGIGPLTMFHGKHGSTGGHEADLVAKWLLRDRRADEVRRPGYELTYGGEGYP